MKYKFSNFSKFLPVLLMSFIGGILILTPLREVCAYWIVDPRGWGIDTMAVDFVSSLLRDNTINLLLYWVLAFSLKLISIGVDIGAWMVSIFLEADVYTHVFEAGVIDQGWTICRDMCNLFFVMFLLIIAFATIFRVQAYSAKALLPKFIFAIFLINFSKVIATIVIDFGQIFMFQFVTWMGSDFGGAGGAAGCLTAQVHRWTTDFSLLTIDDSLTKLLGVSFAVVYAVILMATYFTLAGLLLIRIIALALLIVLSPFAFLLAVFPSTRSKSTEWWKNLINYSLLGPVFVFFIYLATGMAQELTGGYAPADPSLFDDLGGFDQIIIGSIKNFIAIGMLLAAVTLSKSLAGAGAGLVIGGTAGLGLMAGKMYRGARYGKARVGAVTGKPAKAAAAKLGVQTGASRAKDWAGKRIRNNKWTNFVAGEFTLKNESERQAKNKEETDKYAKLYKNQGADYLREKVIDSKYTTPAQTAGAVQELQRTNKLTKEDVDKNVHNIKASGMDREEFTRFAPQYAKDMGFGSKGQNSEEVAQEFTERMVHDGEENKIGDLGLKSGVVVSTIEDKHDDFSGWASKRDKTSKESIQVGIEDKLAKLQEEIHEDSGGKENIYTVSDPKKNKKVEDLQRVRAKIDKKGHKALNDLVLEDVKIDGEVKVRVKTDSKTGRAVFSDKDTTESKKRKIKFAGEMKSGDFKSKTEEFFEEMAEHIGNAQADILRREGKGEQREALKRGAKAKNPELYKYLETNAYYKDVGKPKKSKEEAGEEERIRKGKKKKEEEEHNIGYV